MKTDGHNNRQIIRVKVSDRQINKKIDKTYVYIKLFRQLCNPGILGWKSRQLIIFLEYQFNCLANQI